MLSKQLESAFVTWSMVYAFYANMGEFSIRIPHAPDNAEAPHNDIEQYTVPAPTLREPEGYQLLKKESKQLEALPDTEYSLTLKDLEILEPLELFPATMEDIQDRSKADAFTKFFACVQSGWLVVQSIARVSAGLPITQLELVTLAFVCCALAMYGFWWYKPFDVERGTIVICPVSRRNEVITKLDLTRRGKRIPDLEEDDVIEFLGGIGKTEVGMSGSKMSSLALYVTSTVFSALHLAAWNWEFLLPALRTLWRISGVVATSTIVIPLAFTLLDEFLEFTLGCNAPDNDASSDGSSKSLKDPVTPLDGIY
ncbi:hypothetical protein GP486_004734 [Trichoglossum hirsutum]|uniref:Uncharacterized protein n=1 Tax=Trichoglossum hirsutum TaxID=265104 RepID=A0A9P8RP59_9PEZI|nr:hypothetical protein GP486_004734 [Trichoglossum hirsutum]